MPPVIGTPKTPPHGSEQLLTPPLTGGFDDGNFAIFSNSQVSKATFNGTIASDNTVKLPVVLKSTADNTSTNNEVAGSSSNPTRSPDTPLDSSCEKSTRLSFMDLPLSVRQKVYASVLTVPALICVRQRQASSNHDFHGFIYPEDRELLPGISHALCHHTVDGPKFKITRFQGFNLAILRANKEINIETKSVLYGNNDFEITAPSLEMNPQPDFRVPLFPSGYARLIRHLTIRLRSFYSGRWVLTGGYHEIKHAYRGLKTLTIILELESSHKGFGMVWGKMEDEHPTEYTQRLHATLSCEIFGRHSVFKILPNWIDLRVLFDGDAYTTEELDHNACAAHGTINEIGGPDRIAEVELRIGLVKAFNMMKRKN